MTQSLDQKMETEIKELNLTAPRVTPEQIDALMELVTYETHVVPGTTTTTTIATAIGGNGFTLATGMTACASPENFNEELGRKYAIEDAKAKARDELWKLEGYRLKCTLSNIEAAAKVAHEVNRAYCEFSCDLSQKPWEEAPQWQRDSAIAGVKFHLNNLDAGPEASHESWMAQKEADGWTYGDVKDEDAKTHPCMIPFDDLPPEQAVKDWLFRAVVHGMK